jgi:transcriptional regulator with XRE-family HTH domain
MEHDDYDADAMFLGRVLRRARIAAGLSQEELAKRLGFERTVIAKAETGRRPPSPDVAAAYAREFPQLNALIESGLIEEWAEHVRKNGGGQFPKFFIVWVDEEQTATVLFYWAPTLVPGILQTEAYARAILAPEAHDAESPEDRLMGRMERQQVLTRPQPPTVTVIMSEMVLHRNIGGPAVMYEQLMHLVEMSERPKIIIQVIPKAKGAHVGLAGPASIADHDGEPTVVHLDSFTAAQTTRDPDIISKVREMTDMLRSDALPRDLSRELIMKVAEEQWSTS